jgi:nitrile hydratase accessory protein
VNGPVPAPNDVIPMALLGTPRNERGAVFDEPWEAKAFALAIRLHERGLFTWLEWTQALAAEIGAANAAGQDHPDGSYYQHWLRALEMLLARKEVTSPDELTRYTEAWGRAAARTPHGDPIELREVDLR